MVTTSRNIILLRQVEGSQWCVTERALIDGAPAFANRIATARPYLAACRAAVEASQARRLPIAIQAKGKRPRAFVRLVDMAEGAGS